MTQSHFTWTNPNQSITGHKVSTAHKRYTKSCLNQCWITNRQNKLHHVYLQGIKPEPVAKASTALQSPNSGLDPQSKLFTGIVPSPALRWGTSTDFEPARPVGLRHRRWLWKWKRVLKETNPLLPGHADPALRCVYFILFSLFSRLWAVLSFD